MANRKHYTREEVLLLRHTSTMCLQKLQCDMVNLNFILTISRRIVPELHVRVNFSVQRKTKCSLRKKLIPKRKKYTKHAKNHLI